MLYERFRKLNGIIDVKKALCYTEENDGNYVINNFTKMENEQWKELRLLKLVTFVKAQRTVAVANARHPASPLARLAAVLLISSVKTQRNKSLS
jgi:hypothetical protein